MNEDAKHYYQIMEDTIAELPRDTQEKVYRHCAEDCVRDYVLKEQRRRFDECNGDMDLIYTRYSDMGDTFSRVVEKGHIYEMGYRKCLCHMYDSGFTKSPVDCECSRQSVLYILGELYPDRKFDVQMIDSVLNGADQCLFRIIAE